MRIGIDLQPCQNASRRRGVGRYAMEMTKALVRSGREDDHEFVILLNGNMPEAIGEIRAELADILPQSNIVLLHLPSGTAAGEEANDWRRRAAEIIRHHAIVSLAVDWMFVPGLFEGYWDPVVASVERSSPYRTVVTIFDFIPWDHPDELFAGQHHRAAYMRRMRQATQADMLVSISDFTRHEAIARLGVPPDQIHTCSLGYDPGFSPVTRTSDESHIARLGITGPFVLNTSPFEPRKNLPGLIAGFATLPERLRDGLYLVIAGRMTTGAQVTLQQLARDAGIPSGRLILTGFISDEELVAAYRTCAVFAFPSVSEGFGLPVLEAMACGAAAIGADATSIREVIVEPELLFDPHDPADIARCLTRLLDNPAALQAARHHSLRRAEAYSWRAGAEQLLTAMQSAAASTRRLPPAVTALQRSRGFVIVDGTAGQDNTANRLARDLSSRFDVVLVNGKVGPAAEVDLADVRLATADWFDVNGAGEASIVHVLPVLDRAQWTDRVTAHGGIVVLVPGPAVEAQLPADLPATLLRDIHTLHGVSGWDDLATGRLTPRAAHRYAGATLAGAADALVLMPGTMQPPVPEGRTLQMVQADADTLCAVVCGLAQGIAQRCHRPRTEDDLPVAVGAVGPSLDDACQAAIAITANGALARQAGVFVEIGAMRTRTDERRVVVALAHAKCASAVCTISDRRCRRADGVLAAAMGLNAEGLCDDVVTLRAGDQLILIDGVSTDLSEPDVRWLGDLGVAIIRLTGVEPSSSSGGS